MFGTWVANNIGMHTQRTRAVLTSQQVKDIFHLRNLPADGTVGSASHCRCASRSAEVSRKFGVSPKAIRDIWNRRTWCRVTSSIYPAVDNIQGAESMNTVLEATGLHCAASTSRKVIGRPRGSKDSKPRRRPHINRRSLLDDRKSMDPNQRHAVQYSLPIAEDQSRCDSGESLASCSDRDALPGIEESSLLRTYPFFLQF
jgi:hypothetical protein